MERDKLKKLFELLNRDIKDIPQEGYVNFPCWFNSLHGGKDSRPSAGILVSKDRSFYNCFGCQTKGSLINTLYKLQNYEDCKAAVDFVKNNEALKSGDLPPSVLAKMKLEKGLKNFSKEFDYELSDSHDVAVWSEEEYNNFKLSYDNLRENQYLEKSLNANIETIKKFGIGYDRTEHRVIFPIRRYSDGQLVGIVGRATLRTLGKIRYKNYLGTSRDYLFGEHLIQADLEKPVIIVEGMRDVLFVSQEFDCVGTMGVNTSKAQKQSLLAFNRPLVVMGDGDIAGYKFNNNLEKSVGAKICHLVEGFDPNDLSISELKGRIHEMVW